MKMIPNYERNDYTGPCRGKQIEQVRHIFGAISIDQEALEVFYTLLGTYIIPDDVCDALAYRYTYIDKKTGWKQSKQVTTAIYKGDLYHIGESTDTYMLCKRLTEDYFPDGKAKDILIKGYDVLIKRSVEI